MLIAQLATSGGARAPVAHIASQVFIELAHELEAQGLSRKVSADMFGMALRAYQRKLARLSSEKPGRGDTLWRSLLDSIEAEGPLARSEILARYASDDETLIRGVLHDLCESGLLACTGRARRRVSRAQRARAAPPGHARERARARRAGVGVRVSRRSSRRRGAGQTFASRRRSRTPTPRRARDTQSPAHRRRPLRSARARHPARRRGRLGSCGVRSRAGDDADDLPALARAGRAGTAAVRRRQHVQLRRVGRPPDVGRGRRHARALSQRALATARARGGVQRQARHSARVSPGRRLRRPVRARARAEQGQRRPPSKSKSVRPCRRANEEKSMREGGSLQIVRWFLAALLPWCTRCVLQVEPARRQRNALHASLRRRRARRPGCICGVCTQACTGDAHAATTCRARRSCAASMPESAACEGSRPPARACDVALQARRGLQLARRGFRVPCGWLPRARRADRSRQRGSRERERAGRRNVCSGPIPTPHVRSTDAAAATAVFGSVLRARERAACHAARRHLGLDGAQGSLAMYDARLHECLPDCGKHERNRWVSVLESLTGTYDDYACTETERTVETDSHTTKATRFLTSSRRAARRKTACWTLIATRCASASRPSTAGTRGTDRRARADP